MKSIMRTRPSKNFLIIIGLLLIITGMLYLAHRQHSGSAAPVLELLPLRTASGWGYRILVNHHPFIIQPYIPVIPGHHPFTSEGQALKAGGFLLDKIRHHQQPLLTHKDLQSLGITDSL